MTDNAIQNDAMLKRLPAVQVLWVARFDYPAGKALEPHLHDFYQMIHVLDGSAVARLGEYDHEIQRDTGLILTPQTIHSWQSLGQGLNTLDIKFRVHDPTLVQALASIPLAPIQASASRREALLKDILMIAHQDSIHGLYRCGLLLESLLYELIDEPAPANPIQLLSPTDDPVCMALLTVIEDTMTEWPDHQAVADRVGYSYRHISGRTKDVWGISPVEALHRRRIARSLGYLSEKERTILGVAGLVGYCTEQHYSRHFKRLLGMAPGQWRKHSEAAEITLDQNYTNRLYF